FNDNGHELTADFQYETDKETQTTFVNETLEYNNLPEEPNFLNEEILNLETQNEILLQADYVLPIGESAQFEAGYRGNFEKSETDYQLSIEDMDSGQMVLNPLLSNLFDYEENVNSLYSQYGNKFGNFSFLLGLRLENTQ